MRPPQIQFCEHGQIRQRGKNVILHSAFNRICVALQNVGCRHCRDPIVSVFRFFTKENKTVFGQIELQQICVMRGKDQLFVIPDALHHQRENHFFNIALNIGKMLITIIEAVLARHHGSQEQGHINSFCGPAGKHLPVQKLSFLNDDLLILPSDDEGIFQVSGDRNVLQRRIKGTDDGLKHLQKVLLIRSGQFQRRFDLGICKTGMYLSNHVPETTRIFQYFGGVIRNILQP